MPVTTAGDVVQRPFPERAERPFHVLQAAWAKAAARVASIRSARRGGRQRFLLKVAEHAAALAHEPLEPAVAALRRSLPAADVGEDEMARAFAVVRVASERVLGLVHHDVQLLAGRLMLDGMLAEMQTGEGKTLTATLPAATAALAGLPVHVITANDYLARRDAELMRPVYEALGLSVGVVAEGDSRDARRAAYGCDVTYCTGKEVAFDYLRDRVTLGPDRGRVKHGLGRLARPAPAEETVLRGLWFAVVDEADSVLIDDARTPLVLSRPGDEAVDQALCARALSLAAALGPGEFIAHGRQVTLTRRGADRLGELCVGLDAPWTNPRRRLRLVERALSAHHGYQRDRDYVVRDDRIEIIDENTGRRAPERSWDGGLHQMIELKEGCPLTAPATTLARTTYQRFFRRYIRLGGMTGTAVEVAEELAAVYGLAVVPVPSHRPSRRVTRPARCYTSRAARLRAVVALVERRRRNGRAVLVGARSVADSEELGRLLLEARVPHWILNARQDADEAGIVALAGRPGRVTVATNMAGRGTDIALSTAVRGAGGLHVVVAENNLERRLDRQLIGRCARQGDPGSHESLVSLEDELLQENVGRALRWLAARLARRDGRTPRLLGAWLVARAQRAVAARHARERHHLMRAEERQDERLAFAGRPD